MEAAESNSISLKTREPSVNKVLHQALPRTEPKTCYCCGKTGHFPSHCHFKDAYCHTCGKKGHIAPVCKSAHSGKSSPTQVRKKPSRNKFKSIGFMMTKELLRPKVVVRSLGSIVLEGIPMIQSTSKC